MTTLITKEQYKLLSKIPRDRMSTRAKIFCGTLVENQGKILMVEDNGKLNGYDFPGGKMLWGENIRECAIREFKEESGYKVILDKILTIGQRTAGNDDVDYFRFIFVGKLTKNKAKSKVEDSIVSSEWLDIKDILDNKVKLRSTAIKTEIQKYTEGKYYPLDIMDTYVW